MNQITMEYKVAGKKPLFLINLLILFVFIISLIAFYQPFFDPFGPAQLMVIRIFIPLIVLICLITNVKNRQIALKTNPLLIPFAIYILISLISVLFAFNKEISFKYFIELLLLILGSYFIYSLTDKKFIEKLIVIILIVHTLISCYGIFQHFDMDFFKWNTNFSGRPMGTIGNPDFFAGQLLFPLFLLLSFIFFGRKNRILIVAAFLTSFLAFFYTKVAGAAIGFFCGIAVFFVIFIFLKFDFIKKIFKNKIVFFIVIFSIIFVSVLFFKPCHNKINNVFIEKQRSIAHRFLMWKASLLMVRESPVFGKGIGNYRIYYPYYQAKLLNNPENKKYDYVVTWMPHQNYLLIASETGLAGLFMFLLSIVLFYKIGWEIIFIKKTKDPIPIGIITGMTAILATSFFNTFYNIPSTSLYFFSFLFILNDYRQENPKYYYVRNNYFIILFLMSIIIFIFNLNMDSKSIISNVYLKQANKYAKNKDYTNALKYYENIMDLRPVELCPQMDVSYYYFAAEAFRETGNFQKAVECYVKELELNPYCPEVNNMLGALLGQMGNVDEAIKKLELSIYVAPHYEAAYMNLATAYFIKKDYAKVKEVIDKYVKLNGPTELFENMLKQIEIETKNLYKGN